LFYDKLGTDGDVDETGSKTTASFHLMHDTFCSFIGDGKSRYFQ
jgi:hypothetical protein